MTLGGLASADGGEPALAARLTRTAMMDPAERRTVETLKSSFKHIAATLDTTCITVRSQPTAAASTASQSAAPNTSLARILADHHRIRGSALRCLMTALDIDRLAIDKAHRHIALLHEAGQTREAGQAERAVRGYPPLLEVLHVVMEKNGVEEWDRWTRRENNAEKDAALARYVPFPFTAAANSLTTNQPLPAPIAHLLPTLAERQIYDDPPPSSPHRSPPRTLPPLLSTLPLPAARSSLDGLPLLSEQKQADDGAVDGSSASDERLLSGAIEIEADDRARARRLAAKREKERQQRLEAKKERAIQLAQAEEMGDSDEEKEENKDAESETQNGVPDAANEELLTVNDELDAEVQQLAAIPGGGAEPLYGVRPDSSSPSDAGTPIRPQLLAGVSHSPTAADVSPVNGLHNGDSSLLSPYSAASPQHVNGSLLPLASDAAIDSNGSTHLPPALSTASISSSSSISPPLSQRIADLQAVHNQHSYSPSSQPVTRPIRARKKAPRYGEDDLYTVDEPQRKHHRSSPHKSAAQPPPTDADLDVWEIDEVLCYRFRAYPPKHELAGGSYRSFLLMWKDYPRATWAMEDELVSVDKRQLARLLEWDEWRLLPGNAEVEVEEEQPWPSGGEEAVKDQRKRRRGTPLSKKRRS